MSNSDTFPLPTAEIDYHLEIDRSSVDLGLALPAESKQSVAKKTLSCPSPSTSNRGHFPRKASATTSMQERLKPELAGILAAFYAGHRRNVAVLGGLAQINSNHPEIPRVKKNLSIITGITQARASKVRLGNWRTSIPAETKRAFCMLGIALQPNAHAITFRLGHEVAEAALKAPKGAAAYLSALIKRKLGINEISFTLEYSSSASDENHPLHLHGVACIPDELTEEDVGAVLAPKSTEKVRGYRQRNSNKAIDMQPISTPGAWAVYCNKEYLVTVRKLRAAPDYASHAASRAGKQLYEEITTWIDSRSAQDTPRSAPDSPICSNEVIAPGHGKNNSMAYPNDSLDELERLMAELIQ